MAVGYWLLTLFWWFFSLLENHMVDCVNEVTNSKASHTLFLKICIIISFVFLTKGVNIVIKNVFEFCELFQTVMLKLSIFINLVFIKSFYCEVLLS